MDYVTSLDEIGSWLDAHEELWRLDEFLALARFHACIHDADRELSLKLHDDVASDIEGFRRLELTSVGREVGGDIPRWWIFAREPTVRELHDATGYAFTAAQKLLRSSERVCRNPAPAYQDIMQELGRFLRQHSPEIKVLAEYAATLASKDEIAPAILFSYAVWGTTLRAELSLPVKSERAEIDRLRLAGAQALGIMRQREPTVYGEWHDLLDEAHLARSEARPVAIPATSLLHRSQFEIIGRFIGYFTHLRNSLRHLDYLCQEYSQREHLYADDRFAKSLLRKISRHPSVVETDLWDIKERLEVWDAPGNVKEAAAIRFVERVAAFANGRGGFLLVGVTDKTHEIVGVDDPESRIKHILWMLSTYADTEPDFVKVRALDIDCSGAKTTCIMVVVGETESPVGVRQKDRTYAYPLRVGPGIERVSQKALLRRKAHKKGTSFAFTRELQEWVLGGT